MSSKFVYSASEARAQWKQILDRAVAGEKVYIERGGVQFVLLATPNTPFMAVFDEDDEKPTALDIQAVSKALKEAPVPEGGRYVATPEGVFGPTPEKNNSLAKAKTSEGVRLANEAIEKRKQATDGLKFCKAGHILSANNKCLQKGCKYA